MDFDRIDLLRIIATVGSFVFFIAVAAWAWSARNRNRFDEAAYLPFEEE
jgi:cytochrome c oxidase cbb3-type subunit 4